MTGRAQQALPPTQRLAASKIPHSRATTEKRRGKQAGRLERRSRPAYECRSSRAASRSARLLANWSVAVISECGAPRGHEGRIGALESRDGEQGDQRDHGEEFLHDTSP